MNDKELESIIEKSLTEEKISFKEECNDIVKKIFKKRRRKIRILMCMPILLISTTAFAIGYNMFGLSKVGINDKCMNKAIQNGYICNVDKQAQTFNGLEILVNKFFINDIDLAISFDFKMDNFNVKKIKDINLKNLVILDELGNNIYRNYKVVPKDPEKNIAASMGYSKVIIESPNEFKNTFFAFSDNFPKSKKIYINFNAVLLHCKGEDKEINGNWNFEINVPEIMVNRKNIIYKDVLNNSNDKNEDINIRNVKLTNTGLIVYAKSLNENILNNAKITIEVDGKTIEPNPQIYGFLEEYPFEYTEYGYSYDVDYFNPPEEIIIQIKEKRKERKIKFIKDEI